MRLGLFVPQGWRLDLTGIDPAEQWTTMLEIARAADAGPFESIWVFEQHQPRSTIDVWVLT